MADSTGRGETKSLLLSGTFVAALSGAAYLLAFNYELGYASAFGIPRAFIKVDLVTVLTTFGALLSLILILFLLADFAYSVLTQREDPIRRTILKRSFWLIYFVVSIVVYAGTGPEQYQYIKWFAFLILFLILFDFIIMPLITQRGKGSYFEKLEAVERKEREDKGEGKSLLKILQSTRGGTIVLNLILGLLILLTVCYNMGRAKALAQTDFLLLDEEKPTVVLKVYGDLLICASFNKDSKQIEENLTIKNLTRQDTLKLTNKEVGPLRLAATKDKKPQK